MDNQEKITIVPLAISTEFWVSEIHAGFVLGYSQDGYVKVSSKQDFDTAGNKVYLYPKRIPKKKNVPAKSEYQALCDLAYEARSRGYELRAELVGD